MEHSVAQEEEEETVSPATSEIALYVGLSLAVVVFLVVLLVALSLLRRRRLPSGYRLTQSGQSHLSHQIGPNSSARPDLARPLRRQFLTI